MFVLVFKLNYEIVKIVKKTNTQTILLLTKKSIPL